MTYSTAPPEPPSSKDSGDNAGQGSVQIGIDAMVTNGDGGLTVGATVASTHNLGLIDGASDFGVSAKLASLSMGDDCSHDGLSLPAADAGVQLAFAAAAPADLGVPASDLGLLGADPLCLSSFDVPSLDLCSLHI
jgi:hypothetical protein